MKIKNETLKKLTSEEAQDLGLGFIGCLFLRGQAKARVANYKTTLRTEDEVHYVFDNEFRVELVALASKSEFRGSIAQDWCARVYEISKEEYVQNVQPLLGIKFIK